MKARIRIENWEQFNKRDDIKRPYWFAVPNRLFEQHNIVGLDLETIAVYLYLLCQASQQQSDGEVDVWPEHAQRIGNIPQKILVSALRDLVDRGIISTNGSERICTDPDGNVRYTTRQDTTKYILSDEIAKEPKKQAIKKEKPNFDFEALYSVYPRKRGKSAGMARLAARIESWDEYEAFARAVRKYAHECRMERREERFILHWSSFVGAEGKEPWKDYADPEKPKTPPPISAAPPPPPEPELSPEERQAQMAKIRGMLSAVKVIK